MSTILQRVMWSWVVEEGLLDLVSIFDATFLVAVLYGNFPRRCISAKIAWAMNGF